MKKTKHTSQKKASKILSEGLEKAKVKLIIQKPDRIKVVTGSNLK